MKIVVNSAYSWYDVSEECEKYVKDHGGDIHNRTDPFLIEFIEKHGSKIASSPFSWLQIIEIPDGIPWKIETYEGSEWVTDGYRKWYAPCKK